MNTSLKVTDRDGVEHLYSIEPTFLYPHSVERQPKYRFLNVPQYYAKHRERADIPVEYKRQDGVYFIWDTDRIREQLTDDQRQRFDDELKEHTPMLYAFLPYHSSIFAEMNKILTGSKKRRHLEPGLLIGLNRQRVADRFPMKPTRFETLSRNLFALIHFNDVRPDQGRKTFQDEILELAQTAADRALQYIAKQRDFMKPPGDSPTPEQREIERDHEDWIFNVKIHAQNKPIHFPPITYQSEPQAEQDVVGLFHQLTTLGLFPGIQIFATSQSQTYDCLVRFESSVDVPQMKFRSLNDNPLGLSSFILGDRDSFQTRFLTLEFKNNLDDLIDDLDGESRKDFRQIDICVCWGSVSESFKGYSLERTGPREIGV